MIECFSHLPPVSTTPVVHLELRISPQIFGAWGKMIHEKYQKSKIWRHCPFKLGAACCTAGQGSIPARHVTVLSTAAGLLHGTLIVAVLEDEPSVEEYEDKFNENKEKNVPRINYKF
jgi:hypothetical protein